MAQFGSALEWGSRGRKFESSYPDHKKASDLCRLLAFCFSRKNRLCVIRGMAQGNQKAPEFPPVLLRYFSMSAFFSKISATMAQAGQSQYLAPAALISLAWAAMPVAVSSPK